MALTPPWGAMYQVITSIAWGSLYSPKLLLINQARWPFDHSTWLLSLFSPVTHLATSGPYIPIPLQTWCHQTSREKSEAFYWLLEAMHSPEVEVPDAFPSHLWKGLRVYLNYLTTPFPCKTQNLYSKRSWWKGCRNNPVGVLPSGSLSHQEKHTTLGQMHGSQSS